MAFNLLKYVDNLVFIHILYNMRLFMQINLNEKYTKLEFYKYYF